MQDETRGAIAWLAYRLETGRDARLYGADERLAAACAGEATFERVALRDLVAGGMLTGPLNALFHDRTRECVSLDVGSSCFAGSDAWSGQRFAGRISDEFVFVVDGDDLYRYEARDCGKTVSTLVGAAASPAA